MKTARAYEVHEKGDDVWVLVDRMWPRGIKRDHLPVDLWARDAAPSAELRKWFGHDPRKWEEFKARYSRELDDNPDSWNPILERVRKNRVILLYGSKDSRHDNAVAWNEYLESKSGYAHLDTNRSNAVDGSARAIRAAQSQR